VKKRLIISILAITLVCSLAGAGTMAYFSSQKTSAGTFSTGRLSLGTSGDGGNTFAALEVKNLYPGCDYIPLPAVTTDLINSGTLPFTLYRISASAPVESVAGLDELVTVQFAIDGDPVWTGRLSQLNDMSNEAGSFFDPIKNVAAGETVKLTAQAKMEAAFLDGTPVGNEYQKANLTCDLTIYAKQDNLSENGEPAGNLQTLATTDTYTIKGQEVTRNGQQWIMFDFDRSISLPLIGERKENLIVNIRHEDPNNNSADLRITWHRLIAPAWATTDSLNVDGTINHSDVSVNDDNGQIFIKKSTFPSDWRGFQVQFTGKWHNDAAQTTDWIPWSLNR
jgi:predicted ribosomally synthesized peptide with SipW-like signal peptide